MLELRSTLYDVNPKFCFEDPPRRRRRNAHRVTVHGSRQQRRVLVGTIEHDEPLARAMHAPDGPLMMGTPTCPYRRSSPRRAVSTCRIGPDSRVRSAESETKCCPPSLSSRLAPRIPSTPPAAAACRVPCALHPALADTRSSTRLPSPHWATSPPSIHESASASACPSPSDARPPTPRAN